MEKLTKREMKEQRKVERLEYEKQMDSAQAKKKLLTWGGIAAILLISIFGLYKLATTGTSSSSNATTVAPVNATDIKAGNPKAKAVIIEYADFQCPGCAAAYPLLKQLVQTDGNNVLFVYRFFPLAQIHKNAMISSQAGYAAYKQNKFGEMHDMLFETQKDWEASSNARDTFIGYAKKLGLNVQQFTQDLDSQDTQSFINNEESIGISNGVAHTPTIYLNGKEIDQQATTYDQLKALVDQATK